MIYGTTVDDARAPGPVERLLEDSWESRSRRANRRELLVEGSAAVVFLIRRRGDPAFAHALGHAHASRRSRCCSLVCTRSSRGTIKFPIGAGYVVPSYLVLVPMLLLLPPLAVPLLAAIGLVLGSAGRMLARTASRPRSSCSRSRTPGTRSVRRSCSRSRPGPTGRGDRHLRGGIHRRLPGRPRHLVAARGADRGAPRTPEGA